jgi:hypothetical protein
MKNFKSGLLFLLAVSTSAFQSVLAQPGSGMGFKENCKPLPVYKFDGDMKMRAYTVMGGSDTINMDINALVANNGKYMGMIMNGLPGSQGTGMQMVMDLTDSTAYMLMSLGGKNKGMCMDMNSQQLKAKAKEMGKDSSYDFTKYKKTGKTREILGYTCSEYKYEDKNKTQIFWITDEAGDWWQPYNKAWSGSNTGVKLPENFKGMMLAMSLVDKESENTTIMEVIELNKNKPSEIKTTGYFED